MLLRGWGCGAAPRPQALSNFENFNNIEIIVSILEAQNFRPSISGPVGQLDLYTLFKNVV